MFLLLAFSLVLPYDRAKAVVVRAPAAWFQPPNRTLVRHVFSIVLLVCSQAIPPS
jgi:hypothetical protein